MKCPRKPKAADYPIPRVVSSPIHVCQGGWVLGGVGGWGLDSWMGFQSELWSSARVIRVFNR